MWQKSPLWFGILPTVIKPLFCYCLRCLAGFFFVCRTFAFTCLLSLPNIDGPREYCFWTHATTECLKKKRFGAKGNEYRLLLLNAHMQEAHYTKHLYQWAFAACDSSIIKSKVYTVLQYFRTFSPLWGIWASSWIQKIQDRGKWHEQSIKAHTKSSSRSRLATILDRKPIGHAFFTD